MMESGNETKEYNKSVNQDHKELIIKLVFILIWAVIVIIQIGLSIKFIAAFKAIKDVGKIQKLITVMTIVFRLAEIARWLLQTLIPSQSDYDI